MFLDKTVFRVSVSVSILLVLSFAVTAFMTTIYRREKLALGESHYGRGQQLEGREDGEGAVEEYRKALLYSPDKPEYELSFAGALVKTGRLDEAESHIDQLLQENPTSGVLNLMRGRIATRRRELTKAIDYYERAVYEYWPPARAEDRRKARWELIGLLDQSGRREELIAELMTMYANAPADAGLRMRIGTELLHRSATSEGLQVFRDLTRSAPKSALAHRGLGQALLETGDLVSARHEFERALRLDPKDHGVADSLAQTNIMIDLNPEMPSLTTAERYRRSQNLLRRVLGGIGQCSGAGTNEQVAIAEELLAAKASRDPDQALQLQRTAVQVWNMRGRICESGTPGADPILTAVLERITNE